MKCINCRSCTRLVRVDIDGGAKLSWYCDVCETAFDMYTKAPLDTNSDLYKLTKEKYNQLYGNNLSITI